MDQAPSSRNPPANKRQLTSYHTNGKPPTETNNLDIPQRSIQTLKTTKQNRFYSQSGEPCLEHVQNRPLNLPFMIDELKYMSHQYES